MSFVPPAWSAAITPFPARSICAGESILISRAEGATDLHKVWLTFAPNLADSVAYQDQEWEATFLKLDCG